jgi:hypothetical protein
VASLARHLQKSQTRRASRNLTRQDKDSEPSLEQVSSSGVPIRGRSSTTLSSRSRSASRRSTPYKRRQSSPEDLALSQKRKQAEIERLELELKDTALERLRQQAEEERVHAELLEARIRRKKAQKELDELEQ